MRTALSLILVVLAATPLRSDPVNPDSVIIQDFEKRVADYLQLRKAEEAKLPHLRATASQEKIAHYQRELAEAIMKARKTARQGDIFTPPIDKEFRRLMGFAMQSPDATHIRRSLNNAEPVAVRLEINHPYPAGLPLQSTPPTILLNLPHLPDDMEYRFVNRTLVLLDAKPNLMIDFMANVGP
jgi:hypothetical protein